MRSRVEMMRWPARYWHDTVQALRCSTRLVLCALGLLSTSLVTAAQPPPDVPRLGVLLTSHAAESNPYLEAFRQRLRELGWVEGRNLIVEYRYAERQFERLPALAAELVRLPVDVLFATTPQGAQAAKQATTTIPIVFELLGDPVALGFVESLARPGGNLTGPGGIAPELSGKQLEMLTEIVPGLTRVAVLLNPTNPAVASIWHETARAAQAFGRQLQRLEVSTPEALEGAFAAMVSAHAEALLVLPDSLLVSQRSRIVAMAARHRLPVLAEIRAFAEAGGFLTYGTSLLAQWRHAASYVDRLLKGAKPAELPVERSRQFELVINLKTAKALGITVPPSLLLLADEVIQ